jgi:3-(3-hydroxy-phenyl)propionate hydroxylase
LLHAARPLLLNLGDPDAVDIAPWATRVRWLNASYSGPWELPVLGAVEAPQAVLVRSDGYVAWVGTGTEEGLHDALGCWFGAPE